MNALPLKLFSAERVLRGRPTNGELPDDRELLRRTLKIAWPSMLESFLIALVSLADTVMVSALGDYAIAAVGLCGQPRLLGLAPFLALSTAVSALVARRKGEGDRESAVRVLKLALAVSLVLTVAVSLVCVFFAGGILDLMGAQADTKEYAVEYFSIVMGGIVFNVVSMILNAAQRGAGNTKIAMRTNLTSNLVNICFNYLLINGHFGFPALGVRGAAIATVIGSVVACAMSVISVMHPDGFIWLPMKTGGLRDERSVKALANIGSSTLLEQVLMRFGFLLYAALVGHLGTTAYTTHQIAMNILTISFAFGDGLSVAAVALVGYSLGEKRPDLAHIYGSFCQRCGVICSLTLSIIYVFLGKYIFGIFSKTPQVIADGTTIMKLMTVIVLIQISQVIYTGCLRGSGDTKFTALVSFINIAVLRPLIAYLMIYVFRFGLIGAWVGLIIDQTIRLVMTSIRFQRGKWMKITI
ncbi:MAG: MATE family efflux transporter [Oscillospiraceae bacterium]|nr:MATE family efflux transporter [Oscillospiraceae bacterium]